MVEFLPDSNNTSTSDDPLHSSKLKQSKNPLDLLDSKADENFLADSFFDYDSIKDWIEELASPVMDDAETGFLEVDSTVPVSDPIVERPAPILGEIKSTDLKFVIEEGMSKVSLVSGSGISVLDENTVKSELESGKDGSGRDVESDDSSSASSSSSSSSDESCGGKDEEDSNSGSGKNNGDDEAQFIVNVERDGEIGELEEGEIRVGTEDDNDGDEEVNADHMVAWTENSDDDDEDEEAEIKGGPIRSKNEIKDLPPVPRVDATLLAHHQILPVGVILSIIGNQVIVEGVQKHDPLTEGSVLWITESKFPLGFVDEIFGPVKNPYYSVRFNSESEIPTEIHAGAHISFVPEFANHILNNKDLYKKGYDASGVNDEEMSDEGEFSDDEKELEFKRKQALAKRVMNSNTHEIRNNSRKKNSARAGKFSQPASQHAKIPEARKYASQHAKIPEARKYGQPTPKQAKMPESSKFDHPTSQHLSMDKVQPFPNQNQQNAAPSPSFVDQGNSSAAGQHFIKGTGMVTLFPPPMYNPSFSPTLNGAWPNQMPFQQQQQNPFFPNALPMNAMPWMFQNSQMPMSMANQNPQMPMPMNQNPQMPMPMNQNPQMPVPMNQNPQMPMPMNQNPQMPMPMNQNPQMPMPMNQNPQMPMPMNQNPQMPMPMNQNPQMPMPMNQNPQMPMPMNQNPQMPMSMNQNPQMPMSMNQNPQMPMSMNQNPQMPMPMPNQNPQMPMPMPNQNPQMPMPIPNQNPQMPMPMPNQNPQMPMPNQNPQMPMPNQNPQMFMPNQNPSLPYPQGLMGAPHPCPPNAMTSAVEQGICSGGLQFGQNHHNFRPPEAPQQFNPGHTAAPHQFNPGNLQPLENVAAPQQFNPGASSRQGRKPHGRGGAHFRGRRGSRPTR